MEVETIKSDVEMSWEYLKISDFAEVITGGTPSTTKKEYWESGTIPWLNSGELNQEIVAKCDNHITEFGIANSAAKLMPKDTVLIALTGATTGVVGYLTFEACANQSVTGILPSKRHHPKFLYYYLKSIREKVLSESYGGAQKHISQGYVKDLQIPLPPLATQKRIAEILDAADALRRKDQELLKKYDELAQAIFIDMFGDPVKNEKGWEVRSLIDVAYSKDDVKCGPFGTQLSRSEYKTSGIPIWGIPQINSNFKKAPTEYVSVQKSNELRVYSVEKNDIVMSRKGNVGACALFPEKLDVGILHSDAIRIRVNTNLILPEVLLWQFKKSRILQTQVSNVSSGAIMPGINVTKLKQVKVFVPNINSQKEFSLQLEFLEIQKSLLQNSINSSGNLFNTLIQTAFKGELVA